MKTFYAIAADAVLLVHFLWILFVVLGAFFLRHYRRARLVHLGAVAYSVAIEIFRWTCPLTPLENLLRRRAGREAYEGSFLTHYLERLVYVQVEQWELVLGAACVLALTIYLYYGSAGAVREK